MQPTSTTFSSRFRDLLPPALGLLVLVSLSSIVDLLVAGMTPNFDDIRWRFQLMQIVLASGTQVSLFVALFVVVGALADHRVTVRAAGVAAVIFGVMYLLVIP